MDTKSVVAENVSRIINPWFLGTIVSNKSLYSDTSTPNAVLNTTLIIFLLNQQRKTTLPDTLLQNKKETPN